jgi:hypothetical protein
VFGGPPVFLRYGVRVMPRHLNGRLAEPRLLLALGDDGVKLGAAK